MLNNKMKFMSIFLLSLLLAAAVFLARPTAPAFAGITPTATPAPTDTPAPPTNTPLPPTPTPVTSSTNPDPDPAATETPVPTPEAIPELGAGPNVGQAGFMGMILLGIVALLAVSWWKAWQLYRQE